MQVDQLLAWIELDMKCLFVFELNACFPLFFSVPPAAGVGMTKNIVGHTLHHPQPESLASAMAKQT
jgi:hypothetical protein